MPCRLVLGVIGCVLICVGCAANLDLEETQIFNANAQHTLLVGVIEGETSEFKNIIINGLVETYKDTCSIEVITINDVEQIEQKQYEAIVIFDTCKFWKLSATTKKLIEQLDKEKLVVLLTTGMPKKYSYKGVDAITSASKKDKSQSLVQAIVAQIDPLLKK